MCTCSHRKLHWKAAIISSNCLIFSQCVFLNLVLTCFNTIRQRFFLQCAASFCHALLSALSSSVPSSFSPFSPSFLSCLCFSENLLKEEEKRWEMRRWMWLSFFRFARKEGEKKEQRHQRERHWNSICAIPLLFKAGTLRSPTLPLHQNAPYNGLHLRADPRRSLQVHSNTVSATLKESFITLYRECAQCYCVFTWVHTQVHGCCKASHYQNHMSAQTTTTSRYLQHQPNPTG